MGATHEHHAEHDTPVNGLINVLEFIKTLLNIIRTGDLRCR